MRDSTLRWALPEEVERHDLRLITRFEYGKTRGWWVRVERIDGYRRSKLFSDAPYGGRDAALKAALWFRDVAEAAAPAKRPKPGRPRKNPDGRLYKAQKSRWVKGKRVYYDAWIAYHVRADGRRAETSWSIGKWGFKAAREKAQAWLTRSVANRGREK